MYSTVQQLYFTTLFIDSCKKIDKFKIIKIFNCSEENDEYGSTKNTKLNPMVI